MKKVITYGTFDLLHNGHVRLLERARELGDYLIVGVTSDDFDRTRGKINVAQSLTERMENVRQLNLADEIIVEEYEGQKIDDIIRYGVDIFAIGSDWEGKFDYLNQYCQVVYLDRTQGISSTQLRSESNAIQMGLVGSNEGLRKVYREAGFVNGLSIKSCYCTDSSELEPELQKILFHGSYEEFLNSVNAVYIGSIPQLHAEQIRHALEKGVHVLCESPITLNVEEACALFDLAEKKHCVLMDGIKTAYNIAYKRLLLLLKSRKIGDIISVDTTCTSLMKHDTGDEAAMWNSICAWGPFALLPVFQILGTEYISHQIVTLPSSHHRNWDLFSRISFIYPEAVASIKVGKGVKSEGEMIITGTEGYLYVPAPWWKTDYFEIRYENPADNRRYFYAQEGEGIRLELVNFVQTVHGVQMKPSMTREITLAIIRIMQDFYAQNDVIFLQSPPASPSGSL